MGSVGIPTKSIPTLLRTGVIHHAHKSYNVRSTLEHSMPTARHSSSANKYTIGKNLTPGAPWAKMGAVQIIAQCSEHEHPQGAPLR
jgi:hypothetical protein